MGYFFGDFFALGFGSVALTVFTFTKPSTARSKDSGIDTGGLRFVSSEVGIFIPLCGHAKITEDF